MPNRLLTLDSDDYEIQSDELLIIAINSPGFPYYRLAHYLNKKMGWNLLNIKELYYPSENPSCFLNVLSHVDALNHVQYLLVENRTGYNFWIPTMSDVDHWLVVTGSGLDELTVDADTLEGLIHHTTGVLKAEILRFDHTKRSELIFSHFQSLYNFLDYQDFIYRAE